MTLDTFILEHVRHNPDATFAELVLVGMEAGFNMLGDYQIESPNGPNVIFWDSMSLEFAETVSILIENNEIRFSPASITDYLVDGRALGIPIVSRPPPGNYKTLHWMPVLINSNGDQHDQNN